MSNKGNNLNLGVESNYGNSPLPMGIPSEYTKNTNISNATIMDTLIKSAGPKPLPVYLDLKQRAFLVDPKIASIPPAIATSAEGLVDNLKKSIGSYLTDRQALKRAANLNIFEKRKAKEAQAELELQRRAIKAKRNQELSLISSKQKEAQKIKSAASRLAKNSYSAAQAATKPSFWQRITGKRTVVGGKSKKNQRKQRRSTRRA